MGLAIVKHLADPDGGTVSVASAGADLGSTFSVLLPRVDDDGASSAPGPTGPRSEEHGRPLDSVSVLLVEDDGDGRELMALLLTRAGAEVTSASCVASALEILETIAPNAILSDIAMPGEDGISFIRRARAVLGLRGITVPAIALTAYGGPNEKRRFAAAGFDGHVAKPVEQKVLVEAVLEVVRANGTAHGDEGGGA